MTAALATMAMLTAATAADDGSGSGPLEAMFPAARNAALPKAQPVDPPPADALEIAKKKVRDAYDTEIKAAVNAAGVAQVVGELTGLAADKDVTAPDRFALLDVALEMAATGTDPGLVRQILATRCERFTGQDSLVPMLRFVESRKADGRGEPAVLVETALEISRQAMADDRPQIAAEAVEIAAALMPRLKANDGDRLRPQVRIQEQATAGVTSVLAAADQAAKVIKDEPADAKANTQAGFGAAIRGDWAAAIRYLQKGLHPPSKAAAIKETGLPPAPAAADLHGVAGAWWDASEAVVAQRDKLTGDSILAAPPIVQAACRRHAAALYEQALRSEPGLSDPLDVRLAKNRVEAVRGLPDRPAVPAVGPILGVGIQRFNEPDFLAAEDKRIELFDDLGNACAQGDQRAVLRLQRDLTTVREQWAKSLHLYNRDQALPRRQELVRETLRRQPDYADAHLCDCYLKILDGKSDEAKASLSKSWELVSREPARQLYCGQQLLDTGAAALMLGDRPLAEKVKNFFRRSGFAGHPGVRLYEAMIYVDKNLFSEAVEVLDKVMTNTAGLDRPVITAEYAWLRAASPIERLRDKKAAADAVKETLAGTSGPQWKAWRAHAALLASDGRWDAAIAAVDKAILQAPVLFADELERQRKSYEKRVQYLIERKR